jgi:hypothetical protein
MKQRKPSKGVKIFVASCFGLVVLLVVLSAIFGNSGSPAQASPPTPKSLADLAKAQDSLIKAILKDTVYKVAKVEIGPDSTIKIHVRDPEKGGTDQYFDNSYHLLKTDFIREIAIYKGDKFLYGQGYITAQIVNGWEKKFLSYNGDCRPLKDYLLKSLNDPDSYEHEETSVNYQGDSTFQVITKFRAKNGFGAMTLQIVSASLDWNGTVIDAKIE